MTAAEEICVDATLAAVLFRNEQLFLVKNMFPLLIFLLFLHFYSPIYSL